MTVVTAPRCCGRQQRRARLRGSGADVRQKEHEWGGRRRRPPPPADDPEDDMMSAQERCCAPPSWSSQPPIARCHPSAHRSVLVRKMRRGAPRGGGRRGGQEELPSRTQRSSPRLIFGGPGLTRFILDTSFEHRKMNAQIQSARLGAKPSFQTCVAPRRTRRVPGRSRKRASGPSRQQRGSLFV